MFGFLRRRMRVMYVPPMSAERLLECFRGQEENPLLRGVLHELRGLHELAAQNAEVTEQSDSMTLKYTAMMRAHREAEERILDLMALARQPGNARKRKEVLEDVKRARGQEPEQETGSDVA